MLAYGAIEETEANTYRAFIVPAADDLWETAGDLVYERLVADLTEFAAMAAYLEAALQDCDPKVLAAAMGDLARARGMTQIAHNAGLGRESLYKTLSSDGNPEFGTVLKVVRALGLRLHASIA